MKVRSVLSLDSPRRFDVFDSAENITNKVKLSIKQRQKDKPIKRQTFIHSRIYTDNETQKHTNIEKKGQTNKETHRELQNK